MFSLTILKYVLFYVLTFTCAICPKLAAANLNSISLLQTARFRQFWEEAAKNRSTLEVVPGKKNAPTYGLTPQPSKVLSVVFLTINFLVINIHGLEWWLRWLHFVIMCGTQVSVHVNVSHFIISVLIYQLIVIPTNGWCVNRRVIWYAKNDRDIVYR